MGTEATNEIENRKFSNDTSNSFNNTDADLDKNVDYSVNNTTDLPDAGKEMPPKSELNKGIKSFLELGSTPQGMADQNEKVLHKVIPSNDFINHKKVQTNQQLNNGDATKKWKTPKIQNNVFNKKSSFMELDSLIMDNKKTEDAKKVEKVEKTEKVEKVESKKNMKKNDKKEIKEKKYSAPAAKPVKAKKSTITPPAKKAMASEGEKELLNVIPTKSYKKNLKVKTIEELKKENTKYKTPQIASLSNKLKKTIM